MSIKLISNKNQLIQAECNQPLSRIKPIIVKEPVINEIFESNNAKEMAENQAEFAKQRDLNKKSKMEQFQSQIKIRAKKIEKENKENRQLLQLQKINEKTRFLNVSKDYASRSLNLFKKKQLPTEQSKDLDPQKSLLPKELTIPLKAEVIYPKILEEIDEIDESCLKSIEEKINDYVSLREKLKNFSLINKTFN